MLNSIGIAALAFAPAAWYGPSEAAFDLQVAGSPFDYRENDVRVKFQGPGGSLERLAFWDGKKWRVRLTAPRPGQWKGQVYRNGKPEGPQVSLTVRLGQRSQGYVRIKPGTTKFMLDGGTPYWPMGHNLGWNSPPDTVEKQLETMGAKGLNWARIWACHWDGKNPFKANDGKGPEGRDMFPLVLDRWDAIVESAEKAQVRFQFVLFHHGLFSTRVNPNWSTHPWNKANGGFLDRAADFFSDPEANRRSENWLRYAVARWGHSPAVMSWELFNEVEWVDAKYLNRTAEIGDWHKRMFAFLKKIDPVGRLVTSSSEMDLPIYAGADYYQPHGYPPSVEAMVLGAKDPGDKPFFYGEVGGGTFSEATERGVVRDSAWSGFFAGHDGASQYWYWDRLTRLGLYDELSRAAKLIQRSRLTHDPLAAPRRLDVRGESAGDLVLLPGRGWGATSVTQISLPKDAAGPALGGLSSYLQGEANRSLFPKPLELLLNYPRPVLVTVELGPFAKAGAAVKISGPGAESEVTVGARAEDGGEESVAITVPAGPQKVVIENRGADWAVIRRITLSGVGLPGRALAFGSPTRALARVVRNGGAQARLDLSGFGLRDGRYRIEATDLDNGKTRVLEASLAGGRLAWTALEADAALLMTRAR